MSYLLNWSWHPSSWWEWSLAIAAIAAFAWLDSRPVRR